MSQLRFGLSLCVAALFVGLAAPKAHAQTATATTKAEVKVRTANGGKLGYSIHTYYISGSTPYGLFDVAYRIANKFTGKIGSATIDNQGLEIKNYTYPMMQASTLSSMGTWGEQDKSLGDLLLMNSYYNQTVVYTGEAWSNLKSSVADDSNASSPPTQL